MRARNMQALTDDIVRERPGATVWGKGDRAHQGSPSDHNEDDTPGSKPEQTDADGTPEHRAIDVAKLGPIDWAYLESLRRRLTDRPANQRRLRYVILGQTIWRKRNGWKPEKYTGEYHGHLHASGDVADDENGARWDLATVAPQPIKKGDRMELIYAKGRGWARVGDYWAPIAVQEGANANAAVFAGGNATELTPERWDELKATYHPSMILTLPEDETPA